MIWSNGVLEQWSIGKKNQLENIQCFKLQISMVMFLISGARFRAFAAP